MTHDELELPQDALDGELRVLLTSDSARLHDEGEGDPVAARQVVKRFRGREARRRRVVVAASVLSLAAGALLTLRLRAPSPASQAQLSAPLTGPSSRYVLQHGWAGNLSFRAFERGKPLASGIVRLDAGACLESKDARLCATAPAGARLSLPAASERQLVTLHEGGITAEVFTAQAGYAIATIHGEVSVTSALCTLALDGARSYTLVSVQRGSVRYRELQAAEAALLEGQSVRLGLEPSKISDAPAPVASEVAPVAPVAPQSALVHSAPQPAVSARGPSPGELLDLARQERAARHYSAAALAYRKLEQSFPESAEARAALVSLGQLQLGQLGQPEAALRSFQAYLSAPGQLQQEAEHGSILALQKLGRKTEERRAIEAFVSRYPKSVQAVALRERLKQL